MTMTAPTVPVPRIISGSLLLDEVERFLSRFVVYPSEHARVAHVLWVGHAHRMEAWESTPRIAFLSPEPGSGKSRALEVTEPLVQRPVHAVNTTPAYLFRKVSDEAGLPTILYDEIDTVFGPRAKDNEDVRGMLNAGHRKGAVAGRCVVRGKVVETEELPAYCAVALAGLDDLPDTLMSRSVVVRMRRRAPHETVEAFRYRLHVPEGNIIRDALSSWARSIPIGVWPEMPPGVADRDADVWEALLAVADAAGDTWPERARCAAVTLVTATKSAPPSIGIRLLDDVHSVFTQREDDYIFTEDLLAALVAMDDAPWAELRGQALNARGLARRLSKYEIKPRTVRVGDRTSKGYARADLIDPWSRYLSKIGLTSIESEPTQVAETVSSNGSGKLGPSGIGNVTSVTTSPLGDDGFWSTSAADDYIATTGGDES
jgi:hypothetical protein